MSKQVYGGAFLPNGQPRKRPLTKKFKFTAEEDKKLKELVDQYGREWSKIASMLPGRTGRQCRDRWANYVDPNISTKPWTQQDDNLLLQKYNEIGAHWRVLANCFPSRSINNVRNRVVKLLKQGHSPQSEPSINTSPIPSEQVYYNIQPAETPKELTPKTTEKPIKITNNVTLEDQSYDLDGFSTKLFDIFGEQQQEQIHSNFYDDINIQFLFQ